MARATAHPAAAKLEPVPDGVAWDLPPDSVADGGGTARRTATRIAHLEHAIAELNEQIERRAAPPVIAPAWPVAPQSLPPPQPRAVRAFWERRYLVRPQRGPRR